MVGKSPAPLMILLYLPTHIQEAPFAVTHSQLCDENESCEPASYIFLILEKHLTPPNMASMYYYSLSGCTQYS